MDAAVKKKLLLANINLQQQFDRAQTVVDLRSYRVKSYDVDDVNELPICEMSLACDNLVCDESGNPPTCFAGIFVVIPERKICFLYSSTEIVEKRTDPCFKRSIMIRESDDIDNNIIVGIILYDVKNTATMAGLAVGSVVVKLSNIQLTACSRLPLTTAENGIVGYVTINGWSQVPTRSQLMPTPSVIRVAPKDTRSLCRRSKSLPARMKGCLQYPSYAPLILDNIKNVHLATYRFLSGLGGDVTVHEVIAEPRFCFTIPIQLVEIFMNRQKELLEALLAFAEVSRRIKPRTYETLSFHISLTKLAKSAKRAQELFNIQRNVMKTYRKAKLAMIENSQNYFKPSTKKEDAELAFAPVNLHLQRMWIYNDTVTKSGFHDVVTAGAFCAHHRMSENPGLIESLVNQSKDVKFKADEITNSNRLVQEFLKLSVMTTKRNEVLINLDKAFNLMFTYQKNNVANRGRVRDLAGRKMILAVHMEAVRTKIDELITVWDYPDVEELLSKVGWNRKRIDEDSENSERELELLRMAESLASYAQQATAPQSPADGVVPKATPATADGVVPKTVENEEANKKDAVSFITATNQEATAACADEVIAMSPMLATCHEDTETCADEETALAPKLATCHEDTETGADEDTALAPNDDTLKEAAVATADGAVLKASYVQEAAVSTADGVVPKATPANEAAAATEDGVVTKASLINEVAVATADGAVPKASYVQEAAVATAEGVVPKDTPAKEAAAATEDGVVPQASLVHEAAVADAAIVAVSAVHSVLGANALKGASSVSAALEAALNAPEGVSVADGAMAVLAALADCRAAPSHELIPSASTSSADPTANACALAASAPDIHNTENKLRVRNDLFKNENSVDVATQSERSANNSNAQGHSSRPRGAVTPDVAEVVPPPAPFASNSGQRKKTISIQLVTNNHFLNNKKADKKKGKKNRREKVIHPSDMDVHPEIRLYNLAFFESLACEIKDVFENIYSNYNAIISRDTYSYAELNDAKFRADKVTKIIDDMIKWKRTAHAALSIELELPSGTAQFTAVQFRRDICFSQALTTVSTGLLCWLSSEKIDLVAKVIQSGLGPLCQFEGLLSLYELERAMWGDMAVAIRRLQNVVFRMVKVTPSHPPIPQVTGTRDAVIVEMPVPDDLYDRLHQYQAHILFTVTAVFFNIGINEKADLADALGLCRPQNNANKENLERMMDYYNKYTKVFPNCLEPGAYSLSKPLNEVMKELQVEVKKCHYKNTKVLQHAEVATRLMHGMRFTSCKSAKDRTGMAVTLEQANLLKAEYGLSDEERQKALHLMRSEGCRMSNALKNIGVGMYAFTKRQVLALPEEYRPPVGTYGETFTHGQVPT